MSEIGANEAVAAEERVLALPVSGFGDLLRQYSIGDGQLNDWAADRVRWWLGTGAEPWAVVRLMEIAVVVGCEYGRSMVFAESLG